MINAALSAALPYEQPRLIASASVVKHLHGATEDDLGRWVERLEKMLELKPPAARVQIIEHLRAEDKEG